MEFRIADTFTESLATLSGDEQKAVKTAAFDLQVNPAGAGASFHKLDRARDKNFWSVRVSADIRMIVHRSASSLLLCYVDHHDPAYRWAERRKLETHPKTGAAQLVEIRETVQELLIPVHVPVEAPAVPKPKVYADLSDEQLLSYGVPAEWLEDVRQADEDSILALADHLPQEAAEALLEIAVGGVPQVGTPPKPHVDPFEHPDAQRRFRIMQDQEELERALDFPWEKWTIFLHPAQRQWVEADFRGPARVSGSAGTGKTVVALHRAVFLARKHTDGRVLLTTFSEPLANALRQQLRRLIANEPRLGERIEVAALDAVGVRLYQANFGKPNLAPPALVSELLMEVSEGIPSRFSLSFLSTEWEHVVDAWQLESWEDYRDVARLGRKTRLREPQRQVLWSIFDALRSALSDRGLVTQSEVLARLTALLLETGKSPFDYVVVDEAQDLTVPQLRFLAALGVAHRNGLFLAGDLGQRIFQQPFSWKALGVDVRGRSRTLRVNYRTSHQIRSQADRLLDPEMSDVDGNTETRRGTVSVFNGPKPEVLSFESPEKEIEAVADWIVAQTADGLKPHEIGVFIRSENEMGRAKLALERAGIPFRVLDDRVETMAGFVSVSTMHLAKGLEFRAVAVIACDDEVIPSQERIETVTDEADLEDVYNTERQLLYVACTRARDHLLVTSGNVPSEFLADLHEAG
jgi:hypothetical protein